MLLRRKGALFTLLLAQGRQAAACRHAMCLSNCADMPLAAAVECASGCGVGYAVRSAGSVDVNYEVG